MTSKAFRYEPHRENQLTQPHGREHWEYHLVVEEWHRYRRDHQHGRDQTEAGEYTRNQCESVYHGIEREDRATDEDPAYKVRPVSYGLHDDSHRLKLFALDRSRLRICLA